jgi:lysyl-tRNA synthetase class II
MECSSVPSLIHDRYVDMIANPEVAEIFRTRAKVSTTWSAEFSFRNLGTRCEVKAKMFSVD